MVTLWDPLYTICLVVWRHLMRDINPYCDACYTFQTAVLTKLNFPWEDQAKFAKIIFRGYYSNTTTIERKIREDGKIAYWG